MMAGGALALELLAPLMLAWRWTRALFAVSAALMHGSIWMFMGLDYSAWILTVVAVALPTGIAALRVKNETGSYQWRMPIFRETLKV